MSKRLPPLRLSPASGGEGANAVPRFRRMMPQIDRQAAFTGTKEVAAPLRFDAARLETYLAANAPGFAGPLTVRQFKGGQSNPTYLLETPGRKYVLRRKPPGKLLPSAHAVDREFRVISALHAQEFPVAAPVLYCDDPEIAGTVRLVHGDYRLDNIILAPAAPRVLAVLDWELSTLGDPLADFSYHLMKWHMPPSDTGASTGSVLGLDLAALGIPALDAYVDAYAARTGLDPRPQLPVYL